MIFYEIASSVFLFLPPLIGLIFCYLIILKNENARTTDKIGANWYLAIVFIVFSEQLHGFELFSTILAFLLLYRFLNNYVKRSVTNVYFILVAYCFCGYISTFLMSNLILYFSNEHFVGFNYFYLYYIFLESLMAIAIFKGRVL